MVLPKPGFVRLRCAWSSTVDRFAHSIIELRIRLVDGEGVPAGIGGFWVTEHYRE